MRKEVIKPKLSTPFPDTPPIWTDPITGIEVPKTLEANIQWRMDLLDRAEQDEGMQQDLLDACAASQLFFVNAFCMTWHQFDVVDGRRIEAPYPSQPMITWTIQDELLLRFEWCVKKGEDVLVDKARDMGGSWCCIDFNHWNMLFKHDTTILSMSRNEDYVDKPGNMKALFQKHDFINSWLPGWMRPPDCFLGQANRTHMHWINPVTNSTNDGESTTKHASRGDRRKIAFLDEFGAVQNGAQMRNATRDAALVRIINSTSVPGSEYNRWRSDKTIPVFILPWHEHPDKGKGRYLKQTELGEWQIRAPWYDEESKVRGPKYMATEVDRLDTEPGLSYFKDYLIDKHIAIWGRRPSAKLDVRFRKNLGHDDVMKYIAGRDLSFVDAHEQHDGPLSIWCPLINGRPDQTKHYISGIDTSKGQGASNSVVSTKCIESGEKVGEWADANQPPYDFAQIIVALALWFGGSLPRKLPFIKWENNGPGWDIGRILVKNYLYPYYYRREAEGTITDKKTQSYGFHTGERSKSELLSIYDEKLAHGGYINRSIIALEEARTYIHYPGGGIGPSDFVQESKSAKKTHGDRVIADALTLDDKETPVPKRDKKGPPMNTAGHRFMAHIKSKKKGRGGAAQRKKFSFV